MLYINAIAEHRTYVVQLNEYETAPDFLQLSQNMTSDCLFTFVFFPSLPVSVDLRVNRISAT